MQAVAKKNKTSLFSKGSGIGEQGLLIVLGVLFVIFSVTSPYFFTVKNLTNILGQISLPLISAIGLSLLVISGEVDISIGSLQAFVALPLITVMNSTGSFILGAITAIVVGALVAYDHFKGGEPATDTRGVSGNSETSADGERP